MRVALLLLWAGLSMSLLAQGTHADMAARSARIHAQYAGEHYAEAALEIGALMQDAQGTAWSDSLYRFVYMLGRSTWKAHGTEEGVQAAEGLWRQVRDLDTNGVHQANALDQLSLLYYHLGRMQDCFRVDSMASRMADQRRLPIPVRGKARYNLALAHRGLGRHQTAIHHLLEARTILEASDTLLAIQLSEVCNALGASSWHLGLTRAADGYYQEALGHLGSSDERERVLLRSSTYGNLGVLWQTAGDLARSRTNYQLSLSLCERALQLATDPVDRDAAVMNRAKSYLNLATVYFDLGDEGRAAEFLELSLQDRRSVLEPGDPQLLRVQDRMASLEMNAGNLDRAEQYVEAYRQACATYYGMRSEEYIQAVSKLAAIAARKGRTAQADSLFRESLELGGLVADPTTDPMRALSFKRRATMYVDMGRPEEARQDLEQARKIIARIHGSGNYLVAQCDALLAEAAFQAGDHQAAQAHGSAALQLLQGRLAALDTSDLPQIMPIPGLLPDAVYWKVRAERRKEGPAARPHEWSAELDLAIHALDRNKLALGDRASQLQLIGSQKRLFKLALDVAYDAYASSSAEEDADRFLAISEADRSILLKNRLNEFAGMRFAGVPDSILELEQQLLAAMDINTDDRATAFNLHEAEQKYKELLRVIERDHPAYYALRYGETRVSLKELRQQVVAPQRDLLLYAMGDAHLYMMVVRQDTTVLLRRERAGLEALVKGLNTAIAARQDAAYAEAAHELYQAVFAPVAPFLRNVELMLLPVGPLHNVNFEVLLDRPATGNDFHQQLLLQRHAIAYLLSATTAVQFTHLGKRRSGKVLALAPGFTDELKQDYLAGVKDSALVDRAYLHFVRQPFAVRSAQQLGGLLSARVMVGDEANETGFREQASAYNILHLGTHAEMNAAAPLYSKLVLSKNGAAVQADADGYLHAYEIYELELQAQLAVLTACATGAGRDDEGEGVRSLGYSFAFAGCPSLVVSLWNIDEKVSSEIISGFYANLADGMPKHLALRQAKLQHLAEAPEELVSPYYWAGLVLVGDVAPVHLTTWKRHVPWMIAAALLLGGLGWFLWKRRRHAGS